MVVTWIRGGSSMNIEGKKILVTGVTGTLGEKVAESFVESAEEVRGLVRDESQFNRLREIGRASCRERV